MTWILNFGYYHESQFTSLTTRNGLWWTFLSHLTHRVSIQNDQKKRLKAKASRNQKRLYGIASCPCRLTRKHRCRCIACDSSTTPLRPSLPCLSPLSRCPPLDPMGTIKARAKGNSRKERRSLARWSSREKVEM